MVCVGLVSGSLPRLFVPGSAYRLLAATIASEAAMLPFAWFVVVGRSERAYVVEKSSRVLGKLVGRGR
jgi:hypothetical protein